MKITTKVTTSWSSDFETAELAFENEIQNISAEINDYFGNETSQIVRTMGLTARVDKIISLLERAQQIHSTSSRSKAQKMASAVQDVPITLGGYHEGSGTENRQETEMALDTANSIKDLLMNISFNDMSQKQQLKTVLMEGYVLVNLLRENITEQVIKYKIMSMGLNNGQDQMFTAEPTLAQLFQATELDISKGSISLRLTETSRQFQRLIKKVEDSQTNTIFRNSVLNQMQPISLNESERNLWFVFKDLQQQLSQISGATMNFGQLGESLVEQMANANDDGSLSIFDNNDIETLVDQFYSLLEKGRNNLAYYLGPDVIGKDELLQVKVLSTYGKSGTGDGRGRADIAVFSNVITPLREIQAILKQYESPEMAKEALKSFFTPSTGQGDQPFNKDIEQDIKEAIRQALQKIFSSSS